MELPRPKGEVVLLAARLGIGDEVDGTVRICQAQAGLRGEPAQGRERGRAPGRIGSSCACTAGYRASGRPKRRRSSVTILRVARGSMASTDASARSLHAEMSGHLGYERHAPQGRGLGELPQQRSRQWARRCHADPPQLHGPYLTSTRKVETRPSPGPWTARRPTPAARSSTAPDDYANSHPNSKRSRFNNSGTTPLNRTRKRPIRAL